MIILALKTKREIPWKHQAQALDPESWELFLISQIGLGQITLPLSATKKIYFKALSTSKSVSNPYKTKRDLYFTSIFCVVCTFPNTSHTFYALTET
jgi:hypothetical protein